MTKESKWWAHEPCYLHPIISQQHSQNKQETITSKAKIRKTEQISATLIKNKASIRLKSNNEERDKHRQTDGERARKREKATMRRTTKYCSTGTVNLICHRLTLKSIKRSARMRCKIGLNHSDLQFLNQGKVAY
ncbi:uncharacterized protein LOC143196587 [Rhynchophorus ferrugineus]|uniref:uncharacterized protein LOC143196587 n=1 Tax=Rhynchophorus ferrugineus TaxID=354439 RepID=UPI003FCED116